MTPEEQYNALVTEKNIAEDNVNRINRDIEKYVKVIEGYSKLDAATQEKMAPQMQQVLERYNNLKNERYAQEDRYWVALNNINNYQAQAQAQAQQAPTRAPGTRRKIEVPTEPYPVQSLPNGQIRMSDGSIVGGVTPAPRTQPTTQPTTQPSASTFKNASNGFIEGMGEWVYDNVGRPMWKFFNRGANNLGLISDADRAQNLKIMDEAMNSQLHVDDSVDRNSKAYIYANEGAKAFGDTTKYIDMAALGARALPVRAPVSTAPALPNYRAILPGPNGGYILGY